MWKSCSAVHTGRQCFFPAFKAEFAQECYCWEVVIDYGEWEVQQVKFASPRSLVSRADPEQALGGVALPVGEPIGLLEAAARQGFTDFPTTLVRSMCVDLGIDVSADMNLCKLLKAAIQGTIAGIDDEEVVAILHSRRQPEQLVDSEFWSRDDVLECFDKGDEELVKKYKGDLLDNRSGSASHKSVWAFTKKVVEAKAAAAAKARPRQKAKSAPKGARTFNPRPADLLSEASAQAYVPGGAKVWKDGRENRWVVRYKPYGSISRSWTVYGEIGAFGRCAAWAWAMHVEAGLHPCPFPWVSKYEWRSGA